MSRRQLSAQLRKLLDQVKGERARIVVEHILAYGSITTRELQEKYGHDHPPRAIRDVEEHGVPLLKNRLVDQNGRRIAEYRFGDPSQVRVGRVGGRRAFSKAFKKSLLAERVLRTVLGTISGPLSPGRSSNSIQGGG